MFSRRQTFWYIIGGLLLLLAGVAALAGVTLPYSLPLMLIVAGAIIVVAAVLGHRPRFPAFVIFLVGIVAFGLATSGPYGFSPFTTTEAFELTKAQVSPTVDDLTLLCKVSTGSIKVSFTSNETQIYRIVFTKYVTFFHQPTANCTYSIQNERLTVNASSTTASVDVTLNRNMKSSFTLTTSTGSIRVDVPATATKVKRMIFTTTTGEVLVNMSNTESLESLVATTTTGSVEAHITSSHQKRDATAQLSTTTGRVRLNMNITNIESDITASTTTGSVNDNVVGFTILDKTQRSFHARTPNYALPFLKKLDISAATTTGSIDISAYHG